MLGRGLYGKLSPMMLEQADALAKARCTGPEKMPSEMFKARCERAARLFFPPLPQIVVVSGLHEPHIHPDYYYLFVLGEDHPYYWIAGWLRGKEMKGRIKPAMLHRPHLLPEAMRNDIVAASTVEKSDGSP